MSTTIIFTVVSLSLLGLLLAVVLYFVAQKFKVEEDPRIDIVEALIFLNEGELDRNYIDVCTAIRRWIEEEMD